MSAKEPDSCDVYHIGAPLVEPLPPPSGSIAEQFLDWAESEGADVLGEVLAGLVEGLGGDSAFCGVNYIHPEFGPTARTVSLVFGPRMRSRRPPGRHFQRLARVLAVPSSAVNEYVGRWQAGETVLLNIRALRRTTRHFMETVSNWSLTVPLVLDGEWFGMVGMSTLDEEPPGPSVVEACEVAVSAVLSSFIADAHPGPAARR